MNTYRYDFDEASQIFEKKYESAFSLIKGEPEDDDRYPEPHIVNKYAMAQHSFRSVGSATHMQPIAPPRKFKSVTNTYTMTSGSGSDEQDKLERSFSTFGIGQNST